MPKYPVARWVRIDGYWHLSITLPDHQHVIISRITVWQLLIALRAALRDRPWDAADNGRGGTDGPDGR